MDAGLRASGSRLLVVAAFVFVARAGHLDSSLRGSWRGFHRHNTA
jgi:hypothetical protein